MSSTFLFYALALFAVAGACGLVLFRHPMHGAVSLVVTMIALAGLYALLSAKLIFAIQLIVYAGAIMSLIVFIIMFLNIREEDLPDESKRWQYLLGGAVVLSPLAVLLYRLMDKLAATAEQLPLETNFGGVKEVGLLLFTDWLLPFEIVSILLLVALVGAVVLAGKREGGA